MPELIPWFQTTSQLVKHFIPESYAFLRRTAEKSNSLIYKGIYSSIKILGGSKDPNAGWAAHTFYGRMIQLKEIKSRAKWNILILFLSPKTKPPKRSQNDR